MHTLEELHQHYMAVRARLNAGPPPKPVAIKEPEPEAKPEPVILFFPLPEDQNLTPAQQILKETAEKYGITVRDLKGHCRKLKYSIPRHEAAYRIHMELGFSLPKTGRVLGFRDHTTILNSVRKHQKRMASS